MSIKQHAGFETTIIPGSLIDDVNGWLDRRVFWDESLYQQELERIFRRCWLFVAHESQIKEPGEYISTYMGEDNVLVVRHSDESVRVLVNSCPHRGNKVCYAELGKARSFICNYHGWSFGTDGRLLGMHESQAYETTPGFNEQKDDLGLQEVAKVATYKGLVFATFDPDAPSLKEYFGDFLWYLDIMLDNDEAGTEFLPGAFKNIFRCNWKIGTENAAGDALHAGWTHNSGAEAMLGKSIAPGDGENSWAIHVNGHSWQCNIDYPVGNAAAFGDKRILNYLREREPIVRDRLGERRAKMLAAFSSVNIFPNFSFLPGQSTFRVWHPRGPHRSEMHNWVLVNRSAPDEIKQAYKKGVMMTFSPSGTFEMDDGMNFEYSDSMNRGAETRQRRLYCGVGLKTEIAEPDMPGNVSRGHMNEVNQRAFYRRWADLMSAANWDEVS